MNSNRRFEAPDLIEVMDAAVRYNDYLTQILHTWSKGMESVLDFGAGNGRFAAALHERGVTVHAIEPDPVLRQSIADRGPISYQSFEALNGRLFDGIYTLNVLEHLEDDQAFLDLFHQNLEEGGRLLIYVPAFPILFSANDERVGHFRRYRMQPLLEKVRKAGFIIEEARYVDSIGFVAGLAYRFFGDKDGDLSVGSVELYDRVVFPMSRILDRFLHRFLGKNLMVFAERARTH